MEGSTSDTELRALVEHFYHFGIKHPGSKIGKLFEDEIFSRFQALGLNPRKQEIPITAWECREWSLKLDDEIIESFYIPYTAFSSAEGVKAPLVFLNPKNFDELHDSIHGKIAVVEFEFPDLVGWQLKAMALKCIDPENEIPNSTIHPATWIRLHWDLYHKAAKAGAVGFIGVLKNQPGNNCRYFAPYGFREGDDILKKPIPGLWVSGLQNEKLRQAMNESKELRLLLKGQSFQSSTSNIIGVIPGSGPNNFLMGCHHDTPFLNAVEDSSGMAALIKTVEEIKKIPQLKHSVYVIATAGHFYGSIGTRKFIEASTELLGKTSLALWMEHFGFSAVEENGKLVSAARAETPGIFCSFNKGLVRRLEKLLLKYKIFPALILPPESPLGNYPPTDGGDFHAHGVPIINFISNPVYLLVDDDRLEFVDYERIINFSKMSCELLKSLDHSNLENLKNRDYGLRRKILNFLASLMKVSH